MEKERSIATLTLEGGTLCFDFINTVHAWRGVNLHEYLGSYAEVMAWCEKLEVLDVAERAALLQYASAHPEEADKAMQRIYQVRETLYRLFSALAAGELDSLPVVWLRRFNAVLSGAFSHIAFQVSAGSIIPGWKTADDDLLSPLYPVLRSAYELLTSGVPERIKECTVCGWMMYDQTKNNKRRWCSPSTCGSIEKSKKYYRHKKGQA